ncbi:MAG: hypothetical protein KDK70_13285 [Myxococcales bacterium]|nr:hypothetical protein [Myxococcales bacterium]
MKYLQCNDTLDRRYCAVQTHVPYWSGPAFGRPALALMRERGDEAMRLDLDEAAGGLDLPDRVSNVYDLLVLRQSCAEAVLASHDLGAVEVLPAVLISAKGRVHAEDYVVVNPLGTLDCLDVARSQMGGTPDDPYVRLGGSFCFDAAAIPPGRDVFRVKMIAAGYAFSDRLHDFIRARGYSNFDLRDVPLSGGRDASIPRCLDDSMTR